jgi:hypothetical protein
LRSLLHLGFCADSPHPQVAERTTPEPEMRVCRAKPQTLNLRCACAVPCLPGQALTRCRSAATPWTRRKRTCATASRPAAPASSRSRGTTARRRWSSASTHAASTWPTPARRATTWCRPRNQASGADLETRRSLQAAASSRACEESEPPCKASAPQCVVHWALCSGQWTLRTLGAPFAHPWGAFCPPLAGRGTSQAFVAHWCAREAHASGGHALGRRRKATGGRSGPVVQLLSSCRVHAVAAPQAPTARHTAGGSAR